MIIARGLKGRNFVQQRGQPILQISSGNKFQRRTFVRQQRSVPSLFPFISANKYFQVTSPKYFTTTSTTEPTSTIEPKTESQEDNAAEKEAIEKKMDNLKLTGKRLQEKLEKTLIEVEQHIKLAEFKQTIPKLNQMIQLKPNYSPKIYVYKLTVLMTLKKYDRAIKTAEFALKVFPDQSTIVQLLARIHFDSGNINAAEMMYNQLLEKSPKDALSNNMKGKCLFSRKEYEEANKYFDEALKLLPTIPRHHSDKGDVLCKFGKYEEALIYFDKAIELDNKNYTFAFKKAAALAYLKKYEESLECVNRAIELYPDSKWSYNLKGNILHHLKQYHELLEMTKAPLRLFKDSYIGYYHKGVALYFLERYDMALIRMKKAILCKDIDTITINIANQIIKTCDSRIALREKIVEERKKRKEQQDKKAEAEKKPEEEENYGSDA